MHRRAAIIRKASLIALYGNALLAVAYAGLAELRGVPLATLTAQVADNFARLFG